MNEPIDQAVNRVIEAMYERVGDELTIDDLARTAMYSKFHFSRAFRRVTGVSPGRFLSALRFQEAKRLLTGTSLSVAEISNVVGYSSLGTFSTRFKRKVGVTPTEYRRSAGKCYLSQPERRLDPAHRSVAFQGGTVQGQVHATGIPDACRHTFVGLFPSAVPQGPPVRFTMLHRPGPYVLEDVPEGTWYLLAHGVVDDRAADDRAPDDRAPEGRAPEGRAVEGRAVESRAVEGRAGTGDAMLDPAGSVGQLGPITVRPGAAVSPVDVRLRPMRTVDLPVVFAPFVTRPGSVRRRDSRAGWPRRAATVSNLGDAVGHRTGEHR